MKVQTDPVLQYASRIAYSSLEVLQFTYDMGLRYKDIPGCYVECGCAAGAQIIALAHSAPNKTIYAFDSFEGIPLASNKDNQAPGIAYFTNDEQMSLPDPGKQILQSSGATVVNLQDFCSHILNSGVNGYNIIAVQGWFEETVQKASDKIGPIAILRLDGDLYNSTYVCLKYLFPEVIEGGIIIVDDFALPGCRQAVIDYQVIVLGYYYEPNVIKGHESLVAYWYKKDGTFHPDQPK